MSIRKKLIGFWGNRFIVREQGEQELRDLPEALKLLGATFNRRKPRQGTEEIRELEIPKRGTY